MSGPARVRLRRVYDDPSPSDGTRVLVDRVWPRGITKDAAALDTWLKDVAPSTDLRRWFGHEPGRFGEFRHRYDDELREPGRSAALERLRALAERGTVTVLTATKDLEHSHAAVLAELLAPRERTRATGTGTGTDTGTHADADDEFEFEPGGDPVCWLPRVCPDCGAIADTDPPTTCPRCGEPIPAA